MKNGFFRGHGLGNDYLVMDPKALKFQADAEKHQADLQPQLGAGQRRHLGRRVFEESGFRPSYLQSRRQRSGKIRQRSQNFCPLPPCDGENQEEAFYRGDQRRPRDD